MKQLYFILSLLWMFSFVPMQGQRKTLSSTTALPRPVALPATNITDQGFTANWEKVEGTEAYCVFVYTEHQAQQDETFTVIHEDFDLIDFGTTDNPVWSDEMYEVLDGFTSLPNWSVYGYTTYARGMVGGVVYSPYLDTRNDNGQYKVSLSIYGQSGDEIFVHAQGAEKQTQSFVLDHTGINTHVFDFTNGCKDLFIHINNSVDQLFYVDEFEVTQQLKKGDKGYVMVALNEAVDGSLTEAHFPTLYYAPDAKTVYYDLYAVVREYNDPAHSDRYQQVYSEYSNLMQVNLGKQTGIRQTTAEECHLFRTSQGIGIELPRTQQVQVYDLTGKLIMSKRFESGRHVIHIPSGFYLIHTGNKTFKINL